MIAFAKEKGVAGSVPRLRKFSFAGGFITDEKSSYDNPLRVRYGLSLVGSTRDFWMRAQYRVRTACAVQLVFGKNQRCCGQLCMDTTHEPPLRNRDAPGGGGNGIWD